MNTTKLPMPFQGVISNLSNAQYHSHEAMNSSAFKLLARSPKHFWAKYLDPNREPSTPTPAMKLGTAWHTALFEPEQFDEIYIALPDGLDRRTKEGKALYAEILESGKEPLAADDMERIIAMAVAARSHPVARVIFNQNGLAEQSMFWTDDETGVHCRIRPDYMIPPCDLFPNGLILDGKSAEDASADGFAKSVWGWSMQYQAAFYTDGFQRVFDTIEPPTFIWLAQEKESPYATALYSANDDVIAFGRREYRRLLRVYAECKAADNWPCYPLTIAPIELPPWAQRIVAEANQVVA